MTAVQPLGISSSSVAGNGAATPNKFGSMNQPLLGFGSKHKRWCRNCGTFCRCAALGSAVWHWDPLPFLQGVVG
jgi:hypothetical protein